MTQTLSVPDIIAPHLDVLFCGINPGMMSAATHHHFARPGNRFWKALYLSGFTPRQLTPAEQDQLLEFKLGITNFITRPSASTKELTMEEFKAGAGVLTKKIKKYKPRWLAVLGIEAYRKGFGVPFAAVGKQPAKVGTSNVWLLPNPSGLNAHYSLDDFVHMFAELKDQLIIFD